MPLLHIRIADESTEFLKEVALWCNSLKGSTVYIAVEEVGTEGERKHAHIICEYQLTHANFIKKFSEVENFKKLTGNKCRSIKEMRSSLEVNMEYACKSTKLGVHPTVLFMSITQDDMVEHHIQYWGKYGRLKEAKLEEFRKIPEKESKIKVKKETWFEKICDEFIEDVGIRTFRWIQTDIDFITDYVLRRLGRSRKIVDEFIVKRFVMGLYNHVVVHSNENEVVTEQVVRLRSKMFPDL